MAHYLIAFAATSMLASVIALYVMIFVTFRKRANKRSDTNSDAGKRTRVITASAIRKKIKQLKRKTNTRVTSAIWTVLIGQAMGLYFLFTFVGYSRTTRILIKLNGGFLLLASLLCSVLTILNAWLKKEMVVPFRLAFQAYSFIIALLLLMYPFKSSIGGRLPISVAIMPQLVIYFYILTVVVALALMLWDALYRKHLHLTFDFGKYYRIAVGVGMLIGLGMIIGLKIMRF